jgi:hypothetical protein
MLNFHIGLIIKYNFDQKCQFVLILVNYLVPRISIYLNYK